MLILVKLYALVTFSRIFIQAVIHSVLWNRFFKKLCKIDREAPQRESFFSKAAAPEKYYLKNNYIAGLLMRVLPGLPTMLVLYKPNLLVHTTRSSDQYLK